MVRYFAICSLLFSAFFCLAMDSSQICTYALFEKGHLDIIEQLEGSSNDEVIVFTIVALLSILFALILSFISSKLIYSLGVIIFLSIELFLLQRMMTLFDYQEVIRTSIVMCNNHLMLMWYVLQILFFALSLVYIIKK